MTVGRQVDLVQQLESLELVRQTWALKLVVRWSRANFASSGPGRRWIWYLLLGGSVQQGWAWTKTGKVDLGARSSVCFGTELGPSWEASFCDTSQLKSQFWKVDLGQFGAFQLEASHGNIGIDI